MRRDAKIHFTGPSPHGWHRLQLAAECLQKFSWAYLAPKTSARKGAALVKGSLMHLYIAQHYERLKARVEGRDEEEWVPPAEAVELVARVEGTTEHVPLILRTGAAYEEHYGEEEESGWRIFAVEKIEAARVGPYPITGRLDLIIEDRANRLWVVDTKTTSRMTARHKEFYAIHGQFQVYEYLAKAAYGEDRVAGVLVNMVQLGQTGFNRFEIPKSAEMEARFEQNIIDIEESIERMTAAGRPYDRWPRAMNELTCFSRYGACPYIDLCKWGEGAKTAGRWQMDFSDIRVKT